MADDEVLFDDVYELCEVIGNDDEEEQPDAGINELTFIAEEVGLHPEVLSKSQIPSVKKKKDAAVEKIIAKYEQNFGKTIDSSKFLKKINNMKTRLKKKTDAKRKGNRRIKFLDWEKVMLEAMECDAKTTINKIAGAKNCGIVKEEKDVELEGEPSSSIGTGSAKLKLPVMVACAPPPRKKSLLDQYETEETKNLTNLELQRLVLLEQLNTTRLQGVYFQNKLLQMEHNSAQQNNSVEGSSRRKK